MSLKQDWLTVVTMDVPALVAHKARRAVLRARWRFQLEGVDFLPDVKVHRTVVFEGHGVRLGPFVRIQRGCVIKGPCVIEDDVYINAGVWISGHVHVASGCAIGPFCRLISDHHDVGPPNRRAGRTSYLPIYVGPGCWFGAGVTVLPGVTIGSGSIIAAGAVVNRDIPANVLAAGVPAKVVRQITDKDQ